MRQYPLVQPRYDGERDGVPGPFYVAIDTCIICALPPETAPGNITWDEDFLSRGCEGCPKHCRVSKQPETDDELELMIDAALGSCVSAIRYCGTDAYTLGRLGAHICDALPEPPPEPPKADWRGPWWRFW